VTAYWVERRTCEIGIRMALGAGRWRVLGLILGGAFVQIGIGLAIGVPAAIFVGHLTANKLFGVAPHDFMVLAITMAVLAADAFVAAIVPARCAATMEPMSALGRAT